MIDYRVVYNYLLGGTYWETLPIDIVDVERIELVRGPNAALYGPNAATGVINIITRKPTQNGPQANARVEGALSSRDPDWSNNFRLGQRIASGRFSYKYDTISGGVSANYHSFDRLVNGIYSYGLQRRVSPEELATPFGIAAPPAGPIGELGKTVYPEPNLGVRAVGANGYVAYEPTEMMSFILTGGYQESRSVRVTADLPTYYSPFATNDSQSWYLDLRSHLYHFTFQVSFMAGHQMIPQGKSLLLDNSSREEYDYLFNTLDLKVDYDFTWEWLRVRPGLSYRRAQYSGASLATWEFSESDQKWHDVDDSKVLQNAAVSVALEQTPWKKLRFVEAVRLDLYSDRTEYNYYPFGAADIFDPQTKHGQLLYVSYQFAVTYTPVENHILRASYARANKSPSMMETFFSEPSMQASGNRALNLVTFDTVELGYRNRVNQQIDMSLDLFGTYARDFSEVRLHGLDVANFKAIVIYDNFELKAYQVGVTASFGYTARYFQGRLFATVQQTFLQNLKIFRSFDFSILQGTPPKGVDEPHVGTPDVYGGFYLNYQPIDPLNINFNAYYFSRHTQVHSDIPEGILLANPVRLSGQMDIQQSFILNVKVSYNFWKGLAAFINVRNALNINQPQFIWGDPNHVLIFAGLQYEL
jgi:Outer membrane receptor proteins, mostly Fe transport